MDSIFYYPCDSKGNLLKGFCPTRGLITSYLRDIRIWSKLGISYVVMNGNLKSI